MKTAGLQQIEPVLEYYQSNAQKFIDGLKDFLRIKSISTLPEHKHGVLEAAQFVFEELRALKMSNVKLIDGGEEHNPLVYGEWLQAKDKPTLLIYGHYDVQPADPLDEWTTPPFEADVRDGNIYARGAADDKGQTYLLLKAVQGFMHIHGRLPINVKFLIEGEEEIGSTYIQEFARQNRELVKSDAALICDTEMFAVDLPTIITGLRGLVYTEIECRVARQDLHSGGYGGAAANPFQALAQIITGLKDNEGKIQIDGFYDDVKPPSDDEMKAWASLPHSDSEFLEQQIGGTALVGENGFSVLHRIWARPSLDVHGMPGGFAGEGAKTVIPASARAKISMRLVPDMEPAKIIEAFKKRVKELTPLGAQTEVRILSASNAMVVSTENRFVQAMATAMEKVFAHKTVYVRCGGSIPLAAALADKLAIPVVMAGFGLPDDNCHAPNEKLNLSNFHRGIQAVAHYFMELAK